MMPQRPDYHGQRVALLTQHGKESVIAPVLEPALGCLIAHVQGFDTDSLGTFTGEIARPGSQLDAARRKARKGMELSGLPVGVASEGSFGPDPFTGLFEWDTELVIWIDDQQNIELVGMAQGAARSGHIESDQWSDIQDFAEREGFPTYQLVMRPDGPQDPRVHKGIADWAQLRACFDACLAQSSRGQVFAELDLRAFANPARMQLIGQATRDLLQRMQSACPACEAPGFWVTERQAGLPCAACARPTSSYRAEVWTCLQCQHQVVRPRKDRRSAAPSDCAQCNP